MACEDRTPSPRSHWMVTPRTPAAPASAPVTHHRSAARAVLHGRTCEPHRHCARRGWRAPFDPTPLLSLPSLRSLDLSALSPKPEQLQGLPPLTRLMIQGTFASLLPFLKAVPSLRTVRCSVHSRDEMKFDRTFEKVLAQPGLQVLELCRRVGTLLLHFVRTPTGFRLEAHDWVGLDDLVGLAKRMASFGITQLSVHPARPEPDPDLDVDDWQALLAKTWKEVTVISPYTARRST